MVLDRSGRTGRSGDRVSGREHGDGVPAHGHAGVSDGEHRDAPGDAPAQPDAERRGCRGDRGRRRDLHGDAVGNGHGGRDGDLDGVDRERRHGGPGGSRDDDDGAGDGHGGPDHGNVHGADGAGRHERGERDVHGDAVERVVERATGGGRDGDGHDRERRPADGGLQGRERNRSRGCRNNQFPGRARRGEHRADHGGLGDPRRQRGGGRGLYGGVGDADVRGGRHRGNHRRPHRRRHSRRKFGRVHGAPERDRRRPRHARQVLGPRQDHRPGQGDDNGCRGNHGGRGRDAHAARRRAPRT